LGEWFSYGNRREHFLPEVRSVIEKKAQFLTEIKKCDRKESAAERSFAHSGKNMTYIEEYKEGNKFFGIYLCKSKQVLKTKSR